MSRTKKFLYNSLAMVLLRIVTMIMGFIVPRVMLSAYGSELNGLVSSITQFIGYFSLVEAGLAGASIYALYKPLADNDQDAINAIVSASKNFYMISGYIFTALTFGLALIYPIFVKTNELSPLNVGLLVIVLGIAGAMEFFTMAKYRVLLTADQKSYVISLTSSLAIILNTIIIVVLARMKVNIVVLRLVAVLSVFLRSFILFIYVRLRYENINYKAKPNNKALDKRWDALYLQILGAIQMGTPVVLATMFTDLKAVSVYSIYNMVIGGLDGILSIFVIGLSAGFGEIIARKDLKLLQKTSKEFEFIYFLLLTIAYSVAMVTLMSFIRIYTKGITDTNYNLPLIGILFVINGLMYNIKTPQSMLIASAGMYKETRVQSTIQGLIIVVAGLILTPFWGLAGILIASILSNIYRDVDIMIFIPRNITKLSIMSTANRVIRVFISTIIICLPFCFIRIEPKGYSMWVIFAACVSMYSLIVVGIMGVLFDRAEIKNILVRIKKFNK